MKKFITIYLTAEDIDTLICEGFVNTGDCVIKLVKNPIFTTGMGVTYSPNLKKYMIEFDNQFIPLLKAGYGFSELEVDTKTLIKVQYNENERNDD